MNIPTRSAFLSLLATSVPTWAAPETAPTFNRDVAPIIFGQCVSCHHPGGGGPFPLTSYREVKKRAQQIAQVSASRYMPPWLPAPGHGEFEGTRSLTDEQIALLGQWVRTGAKEGAPAELQVKPEWKDGWKLGPPDLVVTMPEPYFLPASGKDVYRNFVIPSVVPKDRYVVAFEMNPGATRAVHHAFVLLDQKKGARRFDQKDAAPGFEGMNAGPEVGAPRGAFASWQPGATPQRQPEDMAWVLPGDSDLVLQLHLRPTGKKEKVQVSVGFYFTDRPPTRLPFTMCLRSTDIDIPAGAKGYAFEKSYTLPVDGDVISVLPHLHYLGQQAQAWAELPDGTRKELLWIKRWDFNWQGAYRYQHPISLPRGTTVRMRYTYDNSKGNPNNPHQPPRRVQYGMASNDEMGEFWLQFLPHRDAELAVLQRDYITNLALPDKISRAQTLLARDVKDAAARVELAGAYMVSGKLDAAIQECRQALVDDPKSARAYAILSSIYASRNQADEAIAALQGQLQIDPDDSEAHNNLGFIFYAVGRSKEALPHLERALQLNPNDALAKKNLERVQQALRQ